jgi:hypothetical protein
VLTAFPRWRVGTRNKRPHRWRGVHGIPTLARGNEKKVHGIPTLARGNEKKVDSLLVLIDGIPYIIHLKLIFAICNTCPLCSAFFFSVKYEY